MYSDADSAEPIRADYSDSYSLDVSSDAELRPGKLLESVFSDISALGERADENP